MLHRLEQLYCLQATPEPWAYQKHLRLTALLWLSFLPFVLIPSLHLFAIPISSVIGYVVFKLDDVSVELQDPFGWDHSDLTICVLNDHLKAQVCSSRRDSACVCVRARTFESAK